MAWQRKALCHVFRPSDSSVPPLAEAADSQFTGAKAYGVDVDVPPAIEPPRGARASAT